MKNNKYLLQILLTLVLTLSAILTPTHIDASYAANTSGLEVHFIDVGQGDATLIKQGSHAMLIDAGDNNVGTKIQNYLKKQKVSSLDYFVITHTDSDHAGGADVIITKFDCKKVIYPDVSSSTATWRDVLSAMKYKNLKRTDPKVGDTYKLGNASFTILNPQSVKNISDNDTSVALRLVYDKTSFLFVGDAENDAQTSMLKSKQTLSSTVYKVSHHGGKNGTIQKFLDKVDPTYAVISCGEDNSYGHPHAAVMNMLRQSKVKVYRTDEQGSIIASSNGKKITWNCSPSTTWKAGEPTGTKNDDTNQSETIEQPSTDSTYILNTNTKKFHYPSCRSVKQMSEKNKKFSSASRNELIAQGYSPCGNCNP